MPAAKSTTDKPKSKAWIATEPGESITGTMTEMVAVWSDQRGSHYPLLKLDTADGDKVVHCFGAVLYNEVERQRPMPGETVTVTYDGTSTRTPKAGQNPAKLYTMKVEGLNRGAAVKDSYSRLFGDQAIDRMAGTTGDPVAGADEDIPF